MSNPNKLLKIDDARNTYTTDGTALQELDWSNWWSDGTFERMFIHVKHATKGTIHQVMCRKSENARLFMERGRLHWIVEKKGSKVKL